MVTDEALKRQYYQALLAKDSAYEGIFFSGITTTGIFCRPTCPARKPKFAHCQFFEEAKEALNASFRPCLRCQPLSDPDQVSELMQTLITALEQKPEKRWQAQDFKALSVHAATARRQFKKRFGMTFVEYARARKMGIAMKQIQEGALVIDAQLASGYESGSGFREAFSRLVGAHPVGAKEITVLKAGWLTTRLGAMLALADDKTLYLLEFVDRPELEKEVERLKNRLHAVIVPERNPIIEQIEQELAQYFAGTLSVFNTPIKMTGTDFQKQVWQQLLCLAAGQTRPYSEQAKALGRPNAVRAVAAANGRNPLAIVIPCHRVIGADGSLTGYAGGLPRKKWLLEHEASLGSLP